MEVKEPTDPPCAATAQGVFGRNHDGIGVIERAVAWERDARFIEKHLRPLIAP